MEPLPRGPGRAAWPLTCLLLLSLPGWPGAGAQLDQSQKPQQPQQKVAVIAGELLNLTCIISTAAPPGPVKWLKGWGSDNKTVYEQKGSFPRVTRVESQSNTDFSILIRDVQPEDSGTYYCVKFRKNIHGDELLAHGDGTVVSVNAKPSTPVMSGPSSRVGPGESVTFTCTTGGFFPANIGVKWFKNKDPISAQQPQVTPEQNKPSYAMSSPVTLTLQKDDVGSLLTCEVQHPTLPTPLRGTYPLREVLRVPPSVRVVPDWQSSIRLNATVNFTCHVEGFYPGNVTVAWLENGVEMKVKKSSRLQEMPGGLFQLTSQVEVQVTEEKNGSEFICRVWHDGQEPIIGKTTLWIPVPDKEESSNWSQADKGSSVIYIVVGVVCTVLALLVAAILYLIWAKQNKGKSSPSARLHEPEKSSEAAPQESDPNNLTYADLNFERERKTIRRMVEMSQQSEYASIQSSQPQASDDNLTYADLDMVHLNKAPKRPAPRPDEAGSEYASVQIPRK